MRQETTTRTIYKFSELTDDAKENAKQSYAKNDDFPQGREALESLEKLAEHFGARLADYEIDYTNPSYSHAKFDTDHAPHDAGEIRAMLKKLGAYNRRTLKGLGDCVLTGVCYDEDGTDGFRFVFIRKGERDIDALLQAAFDSFLKSIQAEYAYQYTDEAFTENCEANGYEFDESGRMIYRTKSAALAAMRARVARRVV